MAKTFAELVAAGLATMVKGNDVDASAYGKAVSSIKRRGATLDVDMHVAAVAALTLSSLHRDANSAALLLNAMPKGSRAATLALWFETFGNIVVSKDAKTKAYRAKMKPVEECVPVDLEKAQATPFWTKEEKVSGAFDDTAFFTALDKLIKRAAGDKAVLSPAAIDILSDLRVVSAKLPEQANA